MHGRGREHRPATERALVERGLLPGLDFCVRALRSSTRGRVVGAKHLATCAVCLRRWRVTEAELQGWMPMPHDRAASVMADMAAAFAVTDRNDAYRPFYAHVARCNRCERRLAELTFDVELAAHGPGRPAEAVGAPRRPSSDQAQVGGPHHGARPSGS
jgi:hypothetical protein